MTGTTLSHIADHEKTNYATKSGNTRYDYVRNNQLNLYNKFKCNFQRTTKLVTQNTSCIAEISLGGATYKIVRKTRKKQWYVFHEVPK